MPEGSVVFSKIAATSTDTAWSQAYSAGKLFTVLSLKKEASEDSPESENPPVGGSLKASGKNILDALETEFFSLEEKNLESVKAAIETTVKGIPEDLEFSFIVTVLSNNILYSYISGVGRVFIKRGDKFGVILESTQDAREIVLASGFLQNDDLIILATEGFSTIIPKDQLIASTESIVPSEIAENLAPTIHESDEAGAAAIILSYKEEAEAHVAVSEEDTEINTISRDEDIEKASEEDESKKMNPLGFIFPLFGVFKKIIPERLNHSKKIYLTIATLILLVLVTSVILGVKKQNDRKTETAFNAFYPQAQKKFEEGESLKDLNKNLAMDNFSQAQKLLEENKNKFPQGSNQEKQIATLLDKVNTELKNNSPANNAANLDRSKLTITVENGSGAEGIAGKASTFLESLGYKASTTANADNYNYTGATIKVKSDKKDYLDLLKTDLSKNYTITASSSDLSAGSPTDAVVIIGK